MDPDGDEDDVFEEQSRAVSSRVQFDAARNKTSSAESAGQEVLVYPTLFISHGTPALVLQADDPTHIFLRRLGSILPKPQYVIAVSAHWECNVATVTASSRPAIVHDYVGFPQSLYELHYQLRGCPSMAADICETFLEAGIPVAADSHKGFDHGVWQPLMMMWPEGDIQVVQLSLARGLDPAEHAAIGLQLRRILMRFTDCMLLCSGGLTHNLSLIDVGAEEKTLTNKDWVDGKARWTLAFDEWALRTAQASSSKRIEELTNFLHAPGGVLAHPRAEHFIPFVVAAAASVGQGLRLHQRIAYGTMSLAAFGFGGIVKDVLEELELGVPSH